MAKLADVQCSRVQFLPGDRVVVRSRYPLTVDDAKRLRKMVEKWAGADVEVLVIDLTRMEIEIEQSR